MFILQINNIQVSTAGTNGTAGVGDTAPVSSDDGSGGGGGDEVSTIQNQLNQARLEETTATGEAGLANVQIANLQGKMEVAHSTMTSAKADEDAGNSQAAEGRSDMATADAMPDEVQDGTKTVQDGVDDQGNPQTHEEPNMVHNNEKDQAKEAAKTKIDQGEAKAQEAKDVYDRAKAAYDEAQSQLDSAQKQKEQAETKKNQAQSKVTNLQTKLAQAQKKQAQKPNPGQGGNGTGSGSGSGSGKPPIGNGGAFLAEAKAILKIIAQINQQDVSSHPVAQKAKWETIHQLSEIGVSKIDAAVVDSAIQGTPVQQELVQLKTIMQTVQGESKQDADYQNQQLKDYMQAEKATNDLAKGG